MSAATSVPALRLCAGLLLVLSLLGCTSAPPAVEQSCATAWQPAGEVALLCWNLGFGSLGEGAEFFPDGGRWIIPSLRRDVLEYVDGIGSFVQRTEADVYLFQEAARPSLVNHGVDLLAELGRRLPGRWHTYSPEVQLCLPVARVSVGAAVFARGAPKAVERIELPQERGGVRQKVHLLVCRFALPGGELVVANVHLSAFDEGAAVRRGQLATVREWMLAEAARGAGVVLGGDWNLLLADIRFPHTTEERFLFWVHPLPPGFPPPGWKLAVDPSVPTVRTLERPYVRGGNYTAVIDGFVVSPDVEVREVRTFDLGFRFSDHQPVLLRLEL